MQEWARASGILWSCHGPHQPEAAGMISGMAFSRCSHCANWVATAWRAGIRFSRRPCMFSASIHCMVLLLQQLGTERGLMLYPPSKSLTRLLLPVFLFLHLSPLLVWRLGSGYRKENCNCHGYFCPILLKICL